MSVYATYELLKNKEFVYVNFDDERLSFMTAEELNLILHAIFELYQKPKFIFFDEIQNVNGWELFVNRLKRQGFNLIITGSNAKLLSTELATHLTGRHFSLELYPFSFCEYLNFHNFNYSKKEFSTKEIALIKNHLEKYLFFGGFPEVIQGEAYKNYLNSLYSTILTKDVVIRHKIKYLKALRELTNYLISNFAHKITFNKLKNIFSFKSVHTIQNYFSFLEETYLIFSLEKFSYKAKERLTSARKIYIVDSGLINVLALNFSRNIGYVYENTVFLELMQRKIFNVNESIFYWQDSSNREVDFVIKDGLKIKQIIQVCFDVSNYDTKEREVKSLIKASNELKCGNLLIITSDCEGEEKIQNKKIKFVPLWKWLLE